MAVNGGAILKRGSTGRVHCEYNSGMTRKLQGRNRRIRGAFVSRWLHKITYISSPGIEWEGAIISMCNTRISEIRCPVQSSGCLILQVWPESTPEQRESILNDWYREQLKNKLPAVIQKCEQVVGVHASEWKIKTCSLSGEPAT